MSGDTKNERTHFSLYVLESLNFSDERHRRLEGKILRDILRLSGHKVEYLYIRTRQELRVAATRFYRSQRRYLHISCHGNPSTISLTLNRLSFDQFASDLNPFLKDRRLFLSACAVVNEHLAKRIIPPSGCNSIIGPQETINMDDAALMWASFYHLMFRDPSADAMKGKKIRSALRRIRHAFGIEFDYFKKSDTPAGYSLVDIDEK